ncbi:hypothetical protein BGW80DRAFT_893396 [Lactifluus volemus]|nr:hypothetical protein BGW80DRAFT_893396 [Lactifluus volemus]
MIRLPCTSPRFLLTHTPSRTLTCIDRVWISSEDAAAVAAKGCCFIHAASNSFYLDCGAGGWLGDYLPGNSWCDPFKIWQNAYTFDPLANLTSDQASLVLGGQHLLWTEQSGPENLDSSGRAQPYPRRCSGRVPGEMMVRRCRGCTSSVYRFRRRGVNAISLQPEWGALRPFACDLNA